jgi:hypothetical protein
VGDWTTDQIRSAIEAEREQAFELMTELLVRIKKDMIPEVVATLPALRGPVGPAGPAGKLPIAKEWQRETVYYVGEVISTMAPLIRPFMTPASRLTMKRTGNFSRLLVATLSHFAIAAPSKMMLSMPRTTSSRSTVPRFWRCTTSPAYVPVPAGNYCVRRGNAARQENRDREVPQVLPVRRVTTPKSSLAGLLTARATLSRQ